MLGLLQLYGLSGKGMFLGWQIERQVSLGFVRASWNVLYWQTAQQVFFERNWNVYISVRLEGGEVSCGFLIPKQYNRFQYQIMRDYI